MTARSWTVPEGAAGQRLDSTLATESATPRNQVRQWIDAGLVLVDGSLAVKAGALLRAGQRIDWNPPERADDRLEAEEGELRLLHLDDELIVLDKPPGLVMHPGAGRSSATLAHRLLGRFPELAGIGGPGRPGIVHRLDKETSGVLVVARTAAAYQALARDFAERRVTKRYLAIVRGRPKADRGVIDQPIGRHAVRRKKMTVRPDGRRAETHYRVVGSAPSWSLLELDLRTGRTHQIRVHLLHLGHPIAGDPTYGGIAPRPAGSRSLAAPPRVALHAWQLELTHPRSGERLRFEAPLADDLAEWWSALGGSATAGVKLGT
ncbi:MAG: RluA family pseudouridine synthase [Thermoanaerobaculia bacterium]